MKSSLLIPVVLSENLTWCNEKSCTSKAELIKNLFESQAGKFRYWIIDFKLLIRVYKLHYFCRSEKFEVTFGEFGWQAVALRDISQGETIVKIARKDQINVENIVEKFDEYNIVPAEKFDCIESLGMLFLS